MKGEQRAQPSSEDKARRDTIVESMLGISEVAMGVVGEIEGVMRTDQGLLERERVEARRQSSALQ